MFLCYLYRCVYTFVYTFSEPRILSVLYRVLCVKKKRNFTINQVKANILLENSDNSGVQTADSDKPFLDVV